MRILFLSDNYPPEVNAPSNRTYEHCKEWVAQGAEVTVITCFPNFPKGVIYEGYRNKLYEISIEDGIRVIRVWSYMTTNKGFVRRILDYISYATMAFFAGLFIKTDIIVATSPQLFTAFSGSWLAFFKSRPWIMEVRDLWPESIKAVGAMTGQEMTYRILEKLVLGLYKSVQGIVVVTDTFKREIIEKGIDPKKISVVTNGVNLERFVPIPKDEALLATLKIEDKFVIGYIGTHGLAHKLDFILKCAVKIEDPKIHFLFIGSGAEKKNLLELSQNLGLTNVTFLDSVARDRINDYISIVDVALVPLRKSATFRTVIPSKIFENAAMGKPILLGVEGESRKIIESYRAGLCFEPENEAEFLETLSSLYKERTVYETCRKGCRQLAEDYDRKVLAQKMLAYVENLAPARVILNH